MANLNTAKLSETRQQGKESHLVENNDVDRNRKEVQINTQGSQVAAGDKTSNERQVCKGMMEKGESMSKGGLRV